MTQVKSNRIIVDCTQFIPLEAQHTSIPESVKAHILRDALFGKQKYEQARKLRAERRKRVHRSRSDDDDDDDEDDHDGWSGFEFSVDLIHPYAVNPKWYKPLLDDLRKEKISIVDASFVLRRQKPPSMMRISRLCRLRVEFQDFLLSKRIEQLFNTLGGWYITQPSKTTLVTSLRLERAPEIPDLYLLHGQPVVQLVKNADDPNPFSALRLLHPCPATLGRSRSNSLPFDDPNKLFKALQKQLQTSPHIEISWDEWTRYVVPRLKKVYTQWHFAPEGIDIRWDEKAEWGREKEGSDVEDSEIETR